MNLNHLNLTVTGVPQTYHFLEKYFGMRGMSWNNNIGFLTDDNGMVLTLTSPQCEQELPLLALRTGKSGRGADSIRGTSCDTRASAAFFSRWPRQS